jgi:hypothetical protein
MENNENTHPCPICGESKAGEKSFYYIKNLRRHLKLKTHPQVTSRSLNSWTCYKTNCSVTISSEADGKLTLNMIREHMDLRHRDPGFTIRPPNINNIPAPLTQQEHNEGIKLLW